jgi:hypothetical protein
MQMSSFRLTLKQQWTIKISSPFFFIFSLAAILVGSRDQRTQFWKGAIQGSFHKSLVAIGPVVSEEKIFFLISSPLFSNLHNETTGPIATKLLWNDPWMAPFQNCVR